MGSNPITLNMRHANHIILDFESSKNTQNSHYWAQSYINRTAYSPLFLQNVNFNTSITRFQTKFNNSTPSKHNLNLLLNSGNHQDLPNNQLNTVLHLININFLRKEKLYTKLKYSRSPAYDIVSGGAAALLAGFIGFLVSEKFGFELVDSGDFYFLTMYVVFLCFSVRPLLTSTDANHSVWDVFSLNNTLKFYINVITLLFRSLK
jgi:hypothetical protein